MFVKTTSGSVRIRLGYFVRPLHASRRCVPYEGRNKKTPHSVRIVLKIFVICGIEIWECTQVVEETSLENWEVVHSGASVRIAPFPPSPLGARHRRMKPLQFGSTSHGWKSRALLNLLRCNGKGGAANPSRAEELDPKLIFDKNRSV